MCIYAELLTVCLEHVVTIISFTVIMISCYFYGIDTDIVNSMDIFIFIFNVSSYWAMS